MNIIEDARVWLAQRQRAREEAGAATGYVPPPTREEELIRDLHAALVDARAFLEGRTTPPTSKEIAAHGGLNMWLVKFTAHSEILSGRHLAYLCEVPPPEDEEQIERVWCLGTDGRPCAWPKVSP